MDTKRLLDEIVTDFATLRQAYKRTGLLRSDDNFESLAQKLLGSREEVDRFGRDVLLVDAVIRNRVAYLVSEGGAVRHIAVFGGNNVGKSTIINILKKGAGASTSPEGGHTKIAQVFTENPSNLFGQNRYAFQYFSPIMSDPPKERLDCYLVSRTNDGTVPPDVALWDTPDCDAIGSASYVDTVVETVSVADLLLYVTSVEKYAVAHLVEWLFELNDAGIPIIECLNKTPKRDRDIVMSRQAELFEITSKQLGLPAPSPVIVALRNMTEGDESDLWGPEHPEADQLRAEIINTSTNTNRKIAGRQGSEFVLRRLAKTLEPATMEIEARHRWVKAVDNVTSDFVASYIRGYLTSNTTIEPITRLNVQILELLDPNIPGLKQATIAIRWVTRWPSKLVLAVGRRVLKLVFNAGKDETDSKLPPELQVYSEAHTHLLNVLGRRIEEEKSATRHHPFWDILAEDWQDELKRLTERFGENAQSHMKRTDEEIKIAAQDIFEEIRKRPVLVNILRSVKVSANVGGALVGIILPGTGDMVYDLLEDVLVGPAMMIGAEAAANAMAKSYVTGRRDAVIEKLKENARSMAETIYKRPLNAMADNQIGRTATIGIGQELLDRLPKNLEKLYAFFSGAEL